MLINNKCFIYISLLINLVLISFFSVWIIRQGGLSYLASKIPLINIKTNQPESEQNTQTSSQKPPAYYRRLEEFELIDSSIQPETAIAFVGDSLTQFGEWNELLQNAQVINRGISGDTTDDILARIEPIVELKPRKIFVMIGVNDLWHQKNTPEQIVENYETIFSYLKTETPNSKIYIQNLLPVNSVEFQGFKPSNQEIAWLNQELKKISEKFNYQYIDLHSKFVNAQGELNTLYTYDGVHLNGKGYILWRDLVNSYVNEN